MRNPFIVEQLEPRILLSGDILPVLLPLLESRQSVHTASDYILEEAPVVSQVTAGDVVTAACTVVANGSSGGITSADNELSLHDINNLIGGSGNDERAVDETESLTIANIAPGVSGTVRVETINSGQDLTILANDVQLDNTLCSPGAILTIAPLDTSRAIQLGSVTATTSTAETLYFDTTELEKFQPGFARIIFGSDTGSSYIHIGDSTVANDVVAFTDDLVFLNPAQGGEIVIDATLKAKSLTIQGSGHTTLLADKIDVQNSATISDSLEVNGVREIMAGGTGIQLGSTSIVNTLTGYASSSNDVADKLTLTATSGNVVINSEVGDNAGAQSLLKELRVASAGAVTFYQSVSVDGDLTITANGVVDFKSTVTITGSGKLTILGAAQVIFRGKVAVDGGAIVVEGNEIDLLSGSSSIFSVASDGTGGTITLRPATVDFALEIADPPNPLSSGTTLNLTNADLNALADGFTQVIIGRVSGGHAESHASSVRIGAIQSLSTPTILDNLNVYGGRITVEDSVNAGYILSVQGTINLDAYSNIELYNTVEARDALNTTPFDITMYSEAGYVKQLNRTTGADGMGSERLRAATLTIRAATGVDMPWAQINTLVVDNVDSGDISVNVVARDTIPGVGGDVSVTRIAQTSVSGSGNITLTTDNGNITVAASGNGVSTAGTGNITVDANDTGTDTTLAVNQTISGTTAITLEADGAVTISALVSESGAGNIVVQSNYADIFQNANVTSAGGMITCDAGLSDNSGSITMATGVLTDAGAGSVTCTAATDILLSIIDAGGTVTLSANTGSITDNLTGDLVANLNIIGTTTALVLSAKRGIGTSTEDIDTNVYSVTAVNTGTVSSGIFLQERNDLMVTTDFEGRGIAASGTDGSIVLDLLDGSLTVSGAISSTGTVGNILLQTAESSGEVTTTSDIVLNATVSSSTGNISLSAADSMTQNAAGDITTSATGNTIDIKAQAAITMVDGAISTTANGNIRYEAGTGNVTIGEIAAGTAKVAIIATLGTLLDLAVDTSAVDITANDLLLTAGTAIALSSNHLETTVVNLTAKAANGSIFIDETNGVTVKDVSLTVNRVQPGGGVTVTSPVDSQEDLTTTGGHGNIVLKSTTGNIVLADAADINVLGISANGSGNILLHAVAGSIDIQTGVTSGSGNISLLAGTTISQSAAASDVSTGGGTVDLEAGTGISMVDGALTGTSGGNIRYKSTAGNITLAELDAGAGKAAIIATAGTILDLTTDSSTYDIMASDLILTAGTAIGATDNHLETTVTTLSAKTLNGGIFIDEATGVVVDTVTLTVNRVDSTGSAAATTPVETQEDISATGGAVVLQTTEGALTVQPGTAATTGVFASGNILLLSGGSNDIVLHALVTSSGGSVSLNSGKDIAQNAAISVTAGTGSIDLLAVGSITMIEGTSSTTTAVGGGNIRYQAGTNVTIETLAAGTGNVAIYATGGNIVDGDSVGDSEVDITASGLILTAGIGIGTGGNAIETIIATLAASSGSGSMFVTETNDVSVIGVTFDINRISGTNTTAATTSALSDLTTSANGNIVLVSNTGNITITNGSDADSKGVDADGTGNILLHALAGSIDIQSAITSSASGSISILANVNVSQSTSDTADITTFGSGTIDIIAATGLISMLDGTEASTGSGNIRYSAATTLTVGSISTTGNVSLNATGIITDSGTTDTDIIATSLRVSGAQAGTALQHLKTTVTTLAAGITGTVGIFIDETTDLEINTVAAVTVNRVKGDGTITGSAVSDSASLSDINSSGAVVLQTTNGSITTVVDNGDISAAGNILLASGGSNDITLNALVTSNAGSISLNSGKDLTQNTVISVTTGTGSIDLLAAGNITMIEGTSSTSTVVGGGNIRYQAGSNVTIETLAAGIGNVAIYATGGNIVDGDSVGDSEVDITASGLILTAGIGIGTGGNAIETIIATLAASSGSGSMFVTETNDVSVIGVTFDINRISGTNTTAATTSALSDLTTSANGNIVLVSNTGNITITNGSDADSKGVDANGTGNILLHALAGSIDIQSAVTSSVSGSISILANVNVSQSTGDTADITTLGSGTLDIVATTGSISMFDGTEASTGSGNIRYSAATTMTVGSISTTGNVSLNATGSITDSGTTDTDIIATSLRVSGAQAGTALQHLKTTVTTLAAGITGTVGIFIDETTDLEINTVAAVTVNRVKGDGTITGSAVSDSASLSDINSSGAVVLQTTNGSITTVVDNGDISAAGNILLASGGSNDITLNALVTSNAGSISLNSGKDLTQNTVISVTTGTGSIDLLAAGSITMIEGTSSTSTVVGGGNIRYQAGTNVTIETLAAGTGNVAIYATGGNIVDGDSVGDSEVDITASGLILTAGIGIGTGGNAIETIIATLAASSGSGSMFVTETNDVSVIGVTFDINRISGTNTTAATTSALSDLTTSANGNIVLVSNTGNITITNGSDADSKGVDANGTGNILLHALAGSIDIQSAVTSSVSGSISILANVNVSQSTSIAADIQTSSIGTIDVEAVTGFISMLDGAEAKTTGTGNIRYNAATTLTVGTISTTGNVSLNATGTITDSGTIDTDIIATSLRMNGAQAGTATRHLRTNISTFAANITGTVGLFLDEIDAGGDVMINMVPVVTVCRVKGDGTITGSAVSDSASLSDITSGGAVVLQTANGSIITALDNGDISAAGNIRLNAGETASATVAGITLNAIVSTTSGSNGHISILAKDFVTQAATGDITAGGAGTVDVYVSTSTSSGAVTMEDGAATSSTSGNIRYDATTTISLGTITTGGNVSLTGIAITDSADDDAGSVDIDVTAASLRLWTTGAGAGTATHHLETTVGTIAADLGASGNLFVTETNGLVFDTVASIGVSRVGIDANVNEVNDFSATTPLSLSDITTGSGHVIISATDITVNGGGNTTGITTTGAGNIFMQARSGNIEAKAVLDGGTGNISLDASGSVILWNTTGSTAFSGVLRTNNATIDVNSGTLIDMKDGSTITSNGGDIRFEAVNNINVSDVDATTLTSGVANGNVAIISTSGSILDIDNPLTGVDINAAGLLMSAVNGGIGTGSNHLETTVVTLSVSAGDGGVFVTETDSVTVDTVTVNVNRVDTLAVTTTVTSVLSDLVTGKNGNIVLRTTAGNIVLNDGDINGVDEGSTNGYAVKANGSGNILIQALGASTDITANADIMTLNTAGIAKGTGNISVIATQSIVFTGTSDILTTSTATTGGSIDLWANTGSITQSATSLFQTTGLTGTVRLLAATDVTVGNIESSTGTVSITATAGSITDADALTAEVNDNDQDIMANKLRLNAGTAIGASINHLETTVTTLSARTANGSIYLLEADGVTVDNVGLSVNRVLSDATTSAGSSADATQSDIRTTGGNGNIVLRTTAGSIMLNDGTATDDDTAISANGSGNILIQALGAGTDITANADIITLNTAGTTSGTGHITMKAADAITLGSGVDVSTATAGTISLDAEGGALTMAGIATVTATGSSFRLHAYSDMTLGNLTATSVSVISDHGAIINAAGSSKNVTATNLRLVAYGSIGTPDRSLTTNVEYLSADPVIDRAGIYLTEDDDITITSVTVSVTEITATAGLSPVSDQTSDLVTSSNGSIVLVTINGSITLEDADGNGLAISANGTGSVWLTANGTGSDIIVKADLVTGSGEVRIIASGDVEQHADIISSGNKVTVQAEHGSITMDQGVQTLNNDGIIEYHSYKDVVLALLHAESGAVEVYADTGSIGSSSSDLNVQSGIALFQAGVNVGLRNLKPLLLSVDQVAADAKRGEMSLVNEGTIRVSFMNGVNGLAAGDGISLESLKGNLVVAASINTRGRADALLTFSEGTLKGNSLYFDDAGTSLKVKYKQFQFLWDAGQVTLMPPQLELVVAMLPDTSAQLRQRTTAVAASYDVPQMLRGGVQETHTAHGAYSDVKNGNVYFHWGEVEGADSYLLVVERDKMEFASRWLEEIAWAPFEKFPAGIYEWSLYSWATDGLKLVSGPMHFRI